MKKDDQDDTREIQILVSSFSSVKGWKKVRELIKWIFTGIFMGSSDAIPGYSGGTTLALLGFFKRLVIVSKAVFIPTKGIKRRQALFFLLPFGAGWMIGVFGVAKLTELMVKHGMGLELIFFFSFFIVFAIPTFLRSIRRNKNSAKAHLTKKRKIIIMSIAFSLVIATALIVLLVKGGAPIEEDSSISNKFDMSKWWLLMIVAFASGLVTVVPGGSGAIIQLMSSMYDKIHWKIMAHANENIGALFIFAAFNFIGMMTMIFILSWFLQKKERQLEIFSLGMLIAAPIAILIVPNPAIWGHVSDWRHIVGLVTAAGLGAGLGITIDLYTKRAVVQE